MISAAPTCSHLPQPDPPTFARSPALLPTKSQPIHGPAGPVHSQGAGKFARPDGHRARCYSGSLAALRLGLPGAGREAWDVSRS